MLPFQGTCDLFQLVKQNQCGCSDLMLISLRTKEALEGKMVQLTTLLVDVSLMSQSIKLLPKVEMAMLPLFLILHKPSQNLQLPNGGFLLLLDGWVLTGSSKDKHNRSKLISASLTQVSANQWAISITEAMSKFRIHSNVFQNTTEEVTCTGL